MSSRSDPAASIQNLQTDVTIMGGGLAGLTLAKQLLDSRPELDITVVERNRFPVPEAVAKVGESTVEIGSHYLKTTIGLGEHFDQHQLQKFGLRCFMGSGARDFDQLDEIGVSQTFGIPTYQIDRGRIENHLATILTSAGVRILDGATTREVEPDCDTKRLIADTANGPVALNSKWLVDAAGRQALIKNQLELGRDSGHRGNALWFRLDRTIKVDEWSSDPDWQARCTPAANRWLSTNHLMGPGYWVWIIPLASGITSIGIVCDDQALGDSGISKEEDVLPWLSTHQPWLADAITGANFLDFHLVRDYSYDCRQVFSDKGWNLTGEAGVFADPFYSPGSDFIGIGNSLITRLIGESAAGNDVRIRSAVYQKIYNSVFSNTLSIYTGTYGGFGDRKMMGLKLLWDYAYYWGILSLLFYRNALPEIALMQSVSAPLRKAEQLHLQCQMLFRKRASQRFVAPANGLFLDQFQIPCLHHFNDVLKQADNVDLGNQLTAHAEILEGVARFVADMLDDNSAPPPSDRERELMGDYRTLILA